MYIPPVVIDEIKDLKREDEIHANSEAFRKMVKYTRVGREVKRLAKFDFRKSVPRIPVENFDNYNDMIDIPKPPKGKKIYKKNKYAKNNPLRGLI